MEVKIKKVRNGAVMPVYAKPGDAGMDLVAVSTNIDEYGNAVYYTGLSMEIPEGYVGLLFPRSSVCKVDMSLCNSVGVIDSGYRGEIILKFRRTEDFPNMYHVGDKVGQIIILPYPQIKFVESDFLSESERGEGGFGHTGK